MKSRGVATRQSNFRDQHQSPISLSHTRTHSLSLSLSLFLCLLSLFLPLPPSINLKRVLNAYRSLSSGTQVLGYRGYSKSRTRTVLESYSRAMPRSIGPPQGRCVSLISSQTCTRVPGSQSFGSPLDSFTLTLTLTLSISLLSILYT